MSKEPVVERQSSDGQSDDLTGRALRLRIRQQELLAELGVLALQGTSFIEMLNHTARVTAEGLGAEYCKVMEYIPAENRLLVRAGVGWGEGVVGNATVGADLASPAGYALRTGKPVISNHLENEQRFRTPELLVEHGIRRAMNVILQGDGSPFGVLEVDSQSEGEFSETPPSLNVASRGLQVSRMAASLSYRVPNTLVHRRAIMAVAARRRLPAIYPYGFFAREGGLLSYGIVPSDNFRRAAGYVDSIIKGANPGEMPIQVPTKFELVVNLKTAKELDLSCSDHAARASRRSDRVNGGMSAIGPKWTSPINRYNLG